MNDLQDGTDKHLKKNSTTKSHCYPKLLASTLLANSNSDNLRTTSPRFDAVNVSHIRITESRAASGQS